MSDLSKRFPEFGKYGFLFFPNIGNPFDFIGQNHLYFVDGEKTKNEIICSLKKKFAEIIVTLAEYENKGFIIVSHEEVKIPTSREIILC